MESYLSHPSPLHPHHIRLVHVLSQHSHIPTQNGNAKGFKLRLHSHAHSDRLRAQAKIGQLRDRRDYVEPMQTVTVCRHAMYIPGIDIYLAFDYNP
jgi:hypothetical protein